MKAQKYKIQFIQDAFDQKKEIAAFHLNTVFLEYCDYFHTKSKIKTAIIDFKNIMKIISKKNDVAINILKVDSVDRATYGIRNIWSIIRK